MQLPMNESSNEHLIYRHHKQLINKNSLRSLKSYWVVCSLNVGKDKMHDVGNVELHLWESITILW